MDTNQTTLSKSQLAETIISTLSQNILGYVFLKSDGRYYYFKRKSPFPGAIDLMVICVYLRKGTITCQLQSRLDNTIDKFSNGWFLYRQSYLYNSKSELYKHLAYDPNRIYDWEYRFKKSVKALKAALHVLLGDLLRKGRDFIIECDNRYSDPQFLCALSFIENLAIEEQQFERELKEEVECIGRNRYFVRHSYMLEHPLFQELVIQLNKIYIPPKPNLDNKYYAYAFLFEYYFRRNLRRKRVYGLSG